MSGKNENIIADRALKFGLYDDAVVHFSRSIGWYLPWASYFDDSAEKILMIAQQYENKGEYKKAKYAYNILRGAIYSVRSTYTPGEAYLAQCNERIAELSASAVVASSPDGTERDFTGEKERFMRLLGDTGEPSVFWSSLASISFVLWVAFVLALIFSLFKNNLVNFSRDVILILILLTVAYTLWLVSLVKA